MDAAYLIVAVHGGHRQLVHQLQPEPQELLSTPCLLAHQKDSETSFKPSLKPETGRIASKAINQLGDKATKAYQVA